MTLKRQPSSTTRGVSPPTIKRRRLFAETTSSSLGVPESENEDLLFYSWNVNGIQPLLQKRLTFTSSPAYPLREFLKAHNWPQLLCLQEVKIGSKDADTQRRVESAVNAGNQASEPTYTTHFSLPRDKYNATGFGGKVHGVATFVRDDGPFSDIKTSKPDWDLEGRVLIHEFQALALTVINGYWVNGTSNSYRNGHTGTVEGSRHDHKLRFHQHMLNLCKSIELSDRYVILIGDMNIAPQRIDGYPNLRVSPIQHVHNRADFNRKFLDADNEEGLQGLDVFRNLHKDAKRFTYHGRGRPWGESCDRVDLIIASRRLVESKDIKVESDICDTPRERGHSDHVPLWVKLYSVSSLSNHDCQETAKTIDEA